VLTFFWGWCNLSVVGFGLTLFCNVEIQDFVTSAYQWRPRFSFTVWPRPMARR
jgi:hypothetical protein